MSAYARGHHKRGRTTTHSREDALTEREYELLYEGAQSLPHDARSLEAQFVVLVAGRLGLRAGEIAHCDESWVDWRESMIDIPAHDPCEKGEDGGRCGMCRQQIRQCADHYDHVDVDEVASEWWRPKTEAAVRGVPWDWCPRASLVIDRFFDEFGGYEKSQNSVGRRVKRAAEAAPELDPDDIYPHCLRATAASFHASRGLDPTALTSMMGWSNLSTAEVYIARSDENTRRAMRAAHSR